MKFIKLHILATETGSEFEEEQDLVCLIRPDLVESVFETTSGHCNIHMVSGDSYSTTMSLDDLTSLMKKSIECHPG